MSEPASMKTPNSNSMFWPTSIVRDAGMVTWSNCWMAPKGPVGGTGASVTAFS